MYVPTRLEPADRRDCHGPTTVSTLLSAIAAKVWPLKFLAMVSSTPTNQEPAPQASPQSTQWVVTPALLVSAVLSLVVLLAVITFGLLAELRGIQTGFQAGFNQVNTRIDQAATELRGDITELRTELKGDIAGLRAELRDDIAGLRDSVDRVNARIDQVYQAPLPPGS